MPPREYVSLYREERLKFGYRSFLLCQKWYRNVFSILPPLTRRLLSPLPIPQYQYSYRIRRDEIWDRFVLRTDCFKQ